MIEHSPKILASEEQAITTLTVKSPSAGAKYEYANVRHHHHPTHTHTRTHTHRQLYQVWSVRDTAARR